MRNKIRSSITFLGIYICLAIYFPVNAYSRLPKVFDAYKRPDSSDTYNPKIFYAHAGISYGSESPIMGLPKLGFGVRPFADIPYLSNLFFGATASVWYIFAGVTNVGIESGFQFKNISLDGSFTYSKLYSWEAIRGNNENSEWYQVGPTEKLTFNPKIGFRLYMATIKVGPSFKLKEYLTESDKRNEDRPGLQNYFLSSGILQNFNLEVRISVYL